jgi:hypothetical protein
MLLFLLCLAGLWAGAQNALAGGGSFITLPALMLTGLDARAANIASTIALFPGQVANGVAGRSMVSGTDSLSFRTLLIISIFGGAVGGLMLLATPPAFFAALVPWLVLFATTVFAWANFGPKSLMPTAHIGPTTTAVAQFLIAIYGGYFGGGIGFLMIAALSMAGLAVRNAGATKNAPRRRHERLRRADLSRFLARAVGTRRSAGRQRLSRRPDRRLGFAARQRTRPQAHRHRRRRVPDHRPFLARTVKILAKSCSRRNSSLAIWRL